MKRILSIFLCLTLIFVSIPLKASEEVTAKIKQKGFNNTKIDVEPKDKLKMIGAITVIRKGEEISFEKQDSSSIYGEKEYYVGEDELIVSRLFPDDVLKISFNESKKYFKYMESGIGNASLEAILEKDIVIDKVLEVDNYPLKLSLEASLMGLTIKDENNFSNFSKIYVNDEEYLKSEAKFVASKTYYKSDDGIIIASLNNRDKIVFKDASMKILGAYRYIEKNKTFQAIDTQYKVAEEADIINDSPSSGDDQSNPADQLETIESISGMQESFDYVLNILPKNKDLIEKIDTISIDNVDYKRTDYKISISSNTFYLDAANSKIYLLQEIENNKTITFKDKAHRKLACFEKKDENYQKVDCENKNHKELKVKISGKFEAAIVGQKKYDSISGATGSVSQTKNSNVNVYVQEVENGQEPIEANWKLIKDSNIKIIAGRKTNTSRGVIKEDGSGMKVGYNPEESSLILQGIPEKEGDYIISVVIVDKEGREAASNFLPFKIYNLNNVKLIDQLKESNFEKFPKGDDYMWNMEPWEIHTFGGEKETVTIPENLKAIFGSNESGKYGYLGRADQEGIEPIKQTIIIPENRKFSFVNMQLLTSVDVIVKRGAKLNINDSAVYGNIIVEDGGILQVNYNEISKKLTSGSSINGKIILKKGAILENSAIYSNTNSVTDGKKANKNISPVVEVEGDAIIRGNVFIRGDESPTGSDKNGIPYAGQKAMKIKGSTLTVEKDATLGLYGGGKFTTTTNGGDALILENGNIEGEGKLIAVGGSAQGLSKEKKGGDAVSGKGSILIKNAFLQGGYAASDKQEHYGKPFTKDVKISRETLGEARLGKAISSIGNTLIPKEYWNDTIAPGNDENHNPLDYTQILDDIKIVDRLSLKEEQIAEISDKPEAPKIDDNEKPLDPKDNINDDNISDKVYKVERLSGENRYETAIKVSKNQFKSVDTVIIARSDIYPDALAASMLSKVKKAPILLTPSDKLEGNVDMEIQRLGAKNIIIVGGFNAISKNVEESLNAYKIERLAGKDRYETSAIIARKLAKENDIRSRAIIASGEVWADALAAGSFSGKENHPILLVKKDSIPESVSQTIKDLEIKEVYIVGGSLRVSEKVKSQLPSIVKEFAGKDRYETASLIAGYGFATSKSAYLASGESFADSLIIGGVAGLENAPILLTGQKTLSEKTNDYLNNSEVDQIYIIGGSARISENIEENLRK